MKKTMLVVLLVFTLIPFSYYYLDKQVVWYLVAHHSRDSIFLTFIAVDIVKIVAAFVILFYIYFAILLAKFPIKPIDRKLIAVCNSVAIAMFFKEVLKSISGRYLTVSANNPSLVSTHMYGFNWFPNNMELSSFPSGHATLIMAFSTSMWFLFPALRWIWGLLAVLVLTGTAGIYCHFISDVIAGALLGSMVAMIYYRFWFTPHSVH